MHPDARLALRALRDGEETWVRFTPEVVLDLGDEQETLLAAVADFEARDCPAGRAAAEWLRENALDNHGSTVTYLMLRARRVEGFYALSSAQVRLSMRHRRELAGDRGQRYLSLRPLQPASLVAWIAKRNGAATTGRELLMHAFSTALQASELQASIALVLDPYDEETAAMWVRYQGVRASAGQPETRTRLTMTLSVRDGSGRRSIRMTRGSSAAISGSAGCHHPAAADTRL